MRKLLNIFLTIVLAFAIGVPLGLSIDPQHADAELSQAKFVGFMGLGYTDNLGNATGATDAVTIEANAIPDELNCFFSVQNESGVIVANTATVEIQTSYKGADYDVYKSVSVAASVVTGVHNIPAAGLPFGDKWRMNISAIQNANDSYVTGQCIFE